MKVKAVPRKHQGRVQGPGSASGKVFLVGSGPGDPELLTLKAYRLMRQVDVLVYDRLVSQEILELVPQQVRRISVGKSVGFHSIPQSQINQLIIELASAGQRVLRLKGGDPYVFGRGGEEAEALVDAGIPFEVVPGITAAAGASCYAGIPLSHRDYSQSITFATGHLQDDTLNLDWPALARAHSTLVVYMGVGNLAEIARKLVEHGRDAHTPVAVVHKATRCDQKVAVANLATIAAEVERQGIKAPASIIIGEVVALHARLGTLQQALPELERAHQLAVVSG